MELHTPSMWVFIVSLIIAVIAVISVFTPIPKYELTTHGHKRLAEHRHTIAAEV